MTKCIITGSMGLVGNEAVNFFADRFDHVIGIDNGQRSVFFNTDQKRIEFPDNYIHIDEDIRSDLSPCFGTDVKLIIHAAGQPSHDWATYNIVEDFEINAVGTLNLLELTRKYSPDAVFIFTSTNKVYGDYPNDLHYTEYDARFAFHQRWPELDEQTPIDNVKHSFFGCSKLSADLYTQEYGKYLGMKTGVFRCGCITGPNHAGAELHGFLSYLVKCAKNDIPYTIYGYGGKQVRDIIHAHDLVTAFNEFHLNPKPGEVYNMGGGEHSNCSVLEAIEICERFTGRKMSITHGPERIGDHKYWISDVSKFRADYPAWDYKYSLMEIFEEMFA